MLSRSPAKAAARFSAEADPHRRIESPMRRRRPNSRSVIEVLRPRPKQSRVWPLLFRGVPLDDEAAFAAAEDVAAPGNPQLAAVGQFRKDVCDHLGVPVRRV